ncbi:hypothetical protein DR864_08295 [Runella rosea]|uniref:CHAT domain-containing protein n=1 Tax=Runella rosea TaxID=2259595 RepID=A0A344TGG3_9BACT|nr:CHAT domain-containing protein [Runella rosea]AXE17734.1 hypothetical protein DR864_08295 [Runella rosea]
MSNRISVLVGLGYSSEKPLDMSKETSGLFDSLDSKKVDVRYLPNLTFQNLEKKFNSPEDSHQIRIFHYIGHSSLKGIQIEEDGQIIKLSKARLVDLLKPQKLQFVFLNSCLSKEIAKDLHEAGIPVVIGTSESVDNEDAIKIATYFYEALSGQKGRTLIDAFSLTSNHFKALQEQKKSTLKSTFNFRGLGKGEDENQDFAWNIYYENAKEEDKNWCLVPAKKLVLSNAQDDARKKVFCLYGKTQKEYYELLARHANHPKLNVLINGIWEISDDNEGTSDDFVIEWNAADTIAHFLNEDYPYDLEELYQDASNHLQSKNHLFINVDKSQTQAVKFLTKQGIFPNLLLPSAQNIAATFTQENTIREILLKSSHLQTLIEKFEIILLPDLTNFFSLSSDILSKDLEDLDFENEKKPYLAGIPKLFFSLIEGSTDCAQTLLVKTIKKRMGIGSNIKIEVLNVGKNPSIKDPFSFGVALMNLLQVVANPEMMKTCANAILDKKDPFVLVFENVNQATLDIYQQCILDQLWNELIKSYQERIEKGNFTLHYPLMIFALNYEPFSLPVPAPVPLPSVQIEKISPVSPLSENEYNGWYFSKEATYKGFKELIINKHKIVGTQRKVAMIEICKSLNCDHSVIVTKALELS